MTWWSALGLALSLYGVVTLLEWIYDQIVGSHSSAAPAISLVVRVTNQESHVEQAMRELQSFFSQRQWEQRPIEVILWDDGSGDQTEAILERFTRAHPTFRMLDHPSTIDEVLAECQYPFVVWLDLSRHTGTAVMVGGLRQLLGGILPVK